MIIDQLHTVTAARSLLQPIATAQPLTPEVHDGTHAEQRGLLDLVWGGLCCPIGILIETMPVAVENTENTVIQQQHVEIRCRRSDNLAQPKWRIVHERLPPHERNTLDGTSRLLAETADRHRNCWSPGCCDSARCLHRTPEVQAAWPNHSGFAIAQYPL